jgi:hypothetical protein
MLQRYAEEDFTTEAQRTQSYEIIRLGFPYTDLVASVPLADEAMFMK